VVACACLTICFKTIDNSMLNDVDWMCRVLKRVARHDATGHSLLLCMVSAQISIACSQRQELKQELSDYGVDFKAAGCVEKVGFEWFIMLYCNV
jgi:hypothetical protein